MHDVKLSQTFVHKHLSSKIRETTTTCLIANELKIVKKSWGDTNNTFLCQTARINMFVLFELSLISIERTHISIATDHKKRGVQKRQSEYAWNERNYG